MTAAAAGPCPTTSPTAIADPVAVELDDVVPVAAGLGALGAGQVVGGERQPGQARQLAAGSRLRCSVSAMPLLGAVAAGRGRAPGRTARPPRAASPRSMAENRCAAGKPMPMTPDDPAGHGQREGDAWRPARRRCIASTSSPRQLAGPRRPGRATSSTQIGRRSRTAAVAAPAGPCSGTVAHGPLPASAARR